MFRLVPVFFRAHKKMTIQFTVEQEKKDSLPFLDTLLTRREGRLEITVYRKTTHTERHLQYSSHHPENVKRGVTTCLFHQARRITTGENIKIEEEHLNKVLLSNRFPQHNMILAQQNKNKNRESQKKNQ